MEELQRRNEDRLLLRRLRDASNPFELPNGVFRRSCRFPVNLAYDFFLQLRPFLEYGRRNTKLPKVVRFIVALHFYAQGNYQKSVGTVNRCSMFQSAVSNCIKNVTDAIIHHFSARYIEFPSTFNAITEVQNGFFQKFNFPGIIGIIDVSHIVIVPPVFGRIAPRAVLLNRKNYYSINCQIICDSNLIILGISAKYPGSVHDSAIWMMSNIYNDLKIRYRNGQRTSWLIGDSGYPLQPFLLTPTLNAEENAPEGRYNRALCLARNSVERCIGVLKGTFRCLLKDRTLHHSQRRAAKIVIPCATLHNIRKIANINDDNSYFADEEQEEMLINDNVNEPKLHQDGVNIRNNLTRNHF